MRLHVILSKKMNFKKPLFYSSILVFLDVKYNQHLFKTQRLFNGVGSKVLFQSKEALGCTLLKLLRFEIEYQ